MKEGFDLAIRIAKLADSSLIARRFAPIHTVICASPDYLERMGTPQAPDEMIEHRCLVYSLLRDCEYWRLTDAKGNITKTKIRPYF